MARTRGCSICRRRDIDNDVSPALLEPAYLAGLRFAVVFRRFAADEAEVFLGLVFGRVELVVFLGFAFGRAELEAFLGFAVVLGFGRDELEGFLGFAVGLAFGRVELVVCLGLAFGRVELVVFLGFAYGRVELEVFLRFLRAVVPAEPNGLVTLRSISRICCTV